MSAAKSISEIRDIVALVEFQNYSFIVVAEQGKIYLQAVFLQPDIVTGRDGAQYTRKWLLSQYMTKSELVQTAFKCCITSMEHRAREDFKYRGKRIFGPHFDVDGLWGLCAEQRFDVRQEMVPS